MTQHILRFEVWNKIDLLDADEIKYITNSVKRSDDVFMVSALNGVGIPELLNSLSLMLTPDKMATEIKLKFSEGRARAWLFEQDAVTSEQQTIDGFVLKVLWTDRQKKEFSDQYYPLQIVVS